MVKPRAERCGHEWPATLPHARGSPVCVSRFQAMPPSIAVPVIVTKSCMAAFGLLGRAPAQPVGARSERQAVPEPRQSAGRWAGAGGSGALGALLAGCQIRRRGCTIRGIVFPGEPPQVLVVRPLPERKLVSMRLGFRSRLSVLVVYAPHSRFKFPDEGNGPCDCGDNRSEDEQRTQVEFWARHV